jgi:hypothetical protein
MLIHVADGEVLEESAPPPFFDSHRPIALIMAAPGGVVLDALGLPILGAHKNAGRARGRLTPPNFGAGAK